MGMSVGRVFETFSIHPTETADDVLSVGWWKRCCCRTRRQYDTRCALTIYLVGHGMTRHTRCTYVQWRARSQPKKKKDDTCPSIQQCTSLLLMVLFLIHTKKELLSFSEWVRVARYDSSVRGSPKWKPHAAALCSRDTWYTHEKTVRYEVRTNNIGHEMTRHMMFWV